MRTFFLLLTASFLCLGAKSDFTGTWRLDTASTPAIDGKQITSGMLTIEHRHKTVHMSESMKFTDGDKTVDMELRTDHKYHPVTGAGTGEYFAKWEQSSSILAAEHELEGGHESIRLALSPDGRTLTETIHRQSASGVYDRALTWKRP